MYDTDNTKDINPNVDQRYTSTPTQHYSVTQATKQSTSTQKSTKPQYLAMFRNSNNNDKTSIQSKHQTSIYTQSTTKDKEHYITFSLPPISNNTQTESSKSETIKSTAKITNNNIPKIVHWQPL